MRWLLPPFSIYVALGVASGCHSAALPPPLTAAQRAVVQRTHFDVTVGVERDRFPVYSDRLVTALRRTGLFARVAPLADVPHAAVVAHVDRHIYGTATIPCMLFVTLGILPSIADEEWGEAFSLRANGDTEPAVAIDFSYEGPTTLGLWAGVQNLSPRFSSQDPRTTSRFDDALAAAICARAGDVQALLTR